MRNFENNFNSATGNEFQNWAKTAWKGTDGAVDWKLATKEQMAKLVKDMNAKALANAKCGLASECKKFYKGN